MVDWLERQGDPSLLVVAIGRQSNAYRILEADERRDVKVD